MGQRRLPVLLGIAGCVALPGTAIAEPVITVHGTLASPATDVIVGPDGALWHTSATAVGRTTLDGTTTEQGLVEPGGAITRGPDDALWFASGATIQRVAVDGTVSPVTGPAPGPVAGLTTGPDGNVWFTVDVRSRKAGPVGRVTPAGVVTLFDPGLEGDPADIAAGWDGALWFTEPEADRVGRVTTSGDVTEYPAGDRPTAITAGPGDQAMWFTARAAVGRIDGAGAVTSFDSGQPPGFDPGDIVAGGDGALWFTQPQLHRVTRITTAGEQQAFATGTMRPGAITLGPDGALWFTDDGGTALGRLGEPPGGTPEPPGPGGEGPTPSSTPSPAPSGGGAGVAPPVAGKSVVADVVRGIVRIHRPGVPGVVRLRGEANLPVGTKFRTRRGAVRITAAVPATTAVASAARLQTGVFHGGRFQVHQTPGRTRVRIELRGPIDCSARTSATAARKRKKRRRVWSNVFSGLFSTLGLDSVTTVRGTKWLTEDRCDGTLTRVKRGTVRVRSRATGRTFIVSAGQSKLVRHGR